MTGAAPVARRELLDRLLEEVDCAALVVVASSARDPDLAPWTGAAHVGRAVLALPRGGRPRLSYPTPMERGEAVATGLELITPEALGLPALGRAGAGEVELLALRLRGALGAAGVVPGRVALTGMAPSGAVHAACRALESEGWHFVSSGDLGQRLRKRKADAEVAEIRRSAAGAAAALRRVAGVLASALPAAGGEPVAGSELISGGGPLTAGRLRGEAAAELALHGLGLPEGSIVAGGAEGAVPHNRGDDTRRVRAGESLLVDLFPLGTLFADLTRTFCAGPPPPALAAAHEAVCAALDAAAGEAVPGARGWDLQLAACGVFDRHGWPTPVSEPDSTRGYVHNLGHGVGWEVHELPSFKKETGAEGVLEVGDVFTLEPGLYEPEEGWAVRVEETYRLGPEALEPLVDLPRELDPRAY